MRAKDVMTKDVVSVGPDASVHKAAGVMAARRISGLPVINEAGEVLGIVSETDLLHRVELGTGDTPRSWAALFGQKEEDAARSFARVHGTKVHEVMSRPVVSVAADAELADVADTFDRYKIKRVPVVSGGRIEGMITRSDLVRALSLSQPPRKTPAGSSAQVHQAITEALKQQPWLDTSYLNLTVKDGVVCASGYVASEEDRKALAVLINEVAGVERIDDQLKVGKPELGWDGLH